MEEIPKNTILFVDTKLPKRNPTTRIEFTALPGKLSNPAQQRVDHVTGYRILRTKRTEDKGDSL